MSQSEIMALGSPCNLNISFINIHAISLALLVDLNGMKCVALVNLSTITMMESCCLGVVGKYVIKSIKITFHFHYGMGKGYINPAICWFSSFTCWHFFHHDIYVVMSLFIPSQKYNLHVAITIF